MRLHRLFLVFMLTTLLSTACGKEVQRSAPTALTSDQSIEREFPRIQSERQDIMLRLDFTVQDTVVGNSGLQGETRRGIRQRRISASMSLSEGTLESLIRISCYVQRASGEVVLFGIVEAHRSEARMFASGPDTGDWAIPPDTIGLVVFEAFIGEGASPTYRDWCKIRPP